MLSNQPTIAHALSAHRKVLIEQAPVRRAELMIYAPRKSLLTFSTVVGVSSPTSLA